MKAVTSIFLLVSSVSAICPNDCSGHGECDHTSHCLCFNNWMGSDCAQRVCTFGRAFVDSPWGDLDGNGALTPNRAFSPKINFQVQGINYVTSNIGEMGLTEYGYARTSRTEAWDEAHFYRECSNKGLCDRETGLCECFPGYEGSGCRRTACPEDCNGNGVCRTILESNRAGAVDYSAWDGEKTQLCVCDAGWTGPSCGQRSCPRGADPVTYNYKVTDSIQGIYFRTFAPDKQHVWNVTAQQDFLKDKPSKVFFTVTFTDEYDDEWTTRALSVDYTTFCRSAQTYGICLSTPTLGYVVGGTANEAKKIEGARNTLEDLSELLNNSLTALPSDTMAHPYVWSAANPLGTSCNLGNTKGTTVDLVKSVQDCLVHADIELEPVDEFVQYPSPNEEDSDPRSVYVDSLAYRLDNAITKQVDLVTSHTTSPKTKKKINFDGTDNEVFGLGLFVKLPGPGVHVPLQVRYWFTPESSIGASAVKYAHVEGTSTVGSFTEDSKLFLKQDLVVVQNLQAKRMWNPVDGDATMTFENVETKNFPHCANRGVCDLESGICNCFSGYTGLRCDSQNAVTYSY